MGKLPILQKPQFSFPRSFFGQLLWVLNCLNVWHYILSESSRRGSSCPDLICLQVSSRYCHWKKHKYWWTSFAKVKIIILIVNEQKNILSVKKTFPETSMLDTPKKHAHLNYNLSFICSFRLSSRKTVNTEYNLHVEIPVWASITHHRGQ